MACGLAWVMGTSSNKSLGFYTLIGVHTVERLPSRILAAIRSRTISAVHAKSTSRAPSADPSLGQLVSRASCALLDADASVIRLSCPECRQYYHFVSPILQSQRHVCIIEMIVFYSSLLRLDSRFETLLHIPPLLAFCQV